MPSNSILILILLLGVLALSVGNNAGRERLTPGVGRVAEKPHEDTNGNDRCCKYKVKASLPGGSVFQVGDFICIYCSEASTPACADFSTSKFNRKKHHEKEMDKRLSCNDGRKGTDVSAGFPAVEETLMLIGDSCALQALFSYRSLHHHKHADRDAGKFMWHQAALIHCLPQARRA